jgi:hypothetical protein
VVDLVGLVVDLVGLVVDLVGLVVDLVGLVVDLVGLVVALVCDVDLSLDLGLLLVGFLRFFGRAVLPGGAEVERFLRGTDLVGPVRRTFDLVGKEAFFLVLPVRRTFDRVVVLDLFFLDLLLIPSLDSRRW